VSSGAGIVVDVEKLVEEPDGGPGAPSATAAPPAVAAADPFEAPAPSAVAAPASADDFPPIPSDIDDVIDATWTGFSPGIALSGWGEYLSLGLPSAAMLFFEWASYEATAVIAGLMSVNSLATHSILATTASMAFMPILGFGVATMMRIGNRLGERKPAEAQRAFRVGMCVWVVYACLNATFLCSIAPVWGRVFTDDAAVDAHVQRILWILAVYGVFDTGQCILSFVFRAVGRPGLAAVANGTGYMVVGLPLAYSIGVIAKLNVIGLWVGYSIAVTLVFCLLSIVLSRLNWADEAERAYKRAMAPDSHGAAAGH
jgi:MATE family multidrug resistance protein